MGRLHGARRTQISAGDGGNLHTRREERRDVAGCGGRLPHRRARVPEPGRLFAGPRASRGGAPICDPEWDVETRRRHGTDCEISATAYLAHAVWQFGEVERARQLIDHAISRAVELGHIPTLANAYLFKTSLEMFRGDARATLRDAETLVELSGRNGLAYFLNIGTQMRGWARARLSDRDAGVAEMREALGKFAEQGNWGFFPHSSGRLAELEAEGQGAGGALAHFDEALAVARRTGERWTDALLHNIRGDILLKVDPENPARAEEAYLAAIAVAQEQGAAASACRRR